MDLSQFKPKGDLSIIQWPAALKVVNLSGCDKITGTFEPYLTPLVRPTNTNEQPLACGPSRKPPNSSFCPPCPVSPAGDLREIQWPAALQTLNLSGDPFGDQTEIIPMKMTGKL